MGYIEDFHGGRPGITEAVLRRARDDDDCDPYAWLLAAVGDATAVLDLACGNAPLWPALAARAYLGIDSSASELAAARARGAHELLQASATRLPLPDACAGMVTASMALMVLTPLPEVLAEVRRVLVPDGRLVATVPTTGPLRARDLAVVAGLATALGRLPGYPNGAALPQLPDRLARVGLRVITDERRRFGYPLRTAADADLLLRSLYLPGLRPARLRLGRAYLRGLARCGVELAIPLRRIVAVAEPPQPRAGGSRRAAK